MTESIHSTEKNSTSNPMIAEKVVGAAVVLLLVTGVIHLLLAPEDFAELPYLGVLFFAQGIGALVALYGVLAQKRWGWYLGFLVSAGAFAGYVISRTVGLPGGEIEGWNESIGLLSLIVEGGFVALVLMHLKKLLPQS